MRVLALPALAAAALLAGCDGHAGHDHAGHAHEAEPGGGGHHHEAPHGGVLVALEPEVFNAELLHDPATGRLELWFLDGHAVNAVQVEEPTVTLTLHVGPVADAVTLHAVEDALTGDTKAKSSHFAGQSDTLRGAARFAGAIRSVRLGARAYQNVSFEYALPAR